MARKDDLESHIRESYGILHDYEDILRTSDRPEEKARARRIIEEQWSLVEGYLAEYRPLVDDALPGDIAQIAVRFSWLAELSKIERAMDAQEALRGILPGDQVQAALAPLRAKRAAIHAQLWGEGIIAQRGSVVAKDGIAVGGNVSGGIVHTVIQQPTIERVEFTTPQPGPRPDALRVAYLKRLARECGVVRMLGLDTGAGHAETGRKGDVHLEAVYVHLDTMRTVQDQATGRGRARPLEKAEMERPKVLTALEAAARFQRLVLVGGPGAGKSTFASYLALCLAVHGLPPQERPFAVELQEHMAGWPASLWPLPVRVTLREFARQLPAGTRRGTADLLWQHIERRLAPYDEFGAPLKEALLDGQALVLLDGLDEVPVASVQEGVLRDRQAANARPIGPRQLVIRLSKTLPCAPFPMPATWSPAA
jgi:hypothetical protein